MAALPQELIEEILSRLPVKSLLIFKTASKNWYSLISEDHKFHMKQLSSSSSSSASKNLIIYQMRASREGAVIRYSDIDTYESREFIFSVEILRSYQLIGSANGLICLGPDLEATDRCFIWNPCTGEFKRISLLFSLDTDYWSAQENSSYTRLFGFGYDSISDDYKIIGDCDSRIRVFSLKTNSWKRLDFSVKCPSVDYASYSNGALHWCDIDIHITAFDLAKEKIFFIELPEEVKLPYWGCCLQGSLCTSDGKSLWMMREYGNPKSWAKFSTSLPEECSVPAGISRLGEVVYHASGEPGFVYNESLISPKCFDPK